MATILVVDDEPLVLRYVSTILNGYGKIVRHVLTAVDAQAALAICQGAVKLDLLITDIKMAGTGGRELAKIFSDRYPRLPILFISGFIDEDEVRNSFTGEIHLDGHPLIRKPFLPRPLLACVNSLLVGVPVGQSNDIS